MQNFMTYTDVTVEPGPRLNLILGPNGSGAQREAQPRRLAPSPAFAPVSPLGARLARAAAHALRSGKSSLVCALCLGLAGATSVRPPVNAAPPPPLTRPQLLGRAKELKDFVKRGESSATVTVSLSSGNPARPLVVSRVMDAENHSKWTLNGAACLQNKVVEAVAGLNVQLDNLCQFLPQDRVVAFAQMSPCELLVETEKAFGARELHEAHVKLLNGKQGMKDLEREVAAAGTELEKLQAANAGMERDVERFKKREEMTAKAEAMQAKLPWLRYEGARLAVDGVKATLATAKAAADKAQAELDATTAPLTAKKKAAAAAVQAAREDAKRAKAADGEFRAAAAAAEEAEDKVLEEAGKVETCRKLAAARETKVAKLSTDVEAAKAALADLQRNAGPDALARKKQLAELKARLKSDMAEVARADDACAEAEGRKRVPRAVEHHALQKLSALENTRAQRLGLLGENSANVRAAADLAARMQADGRLSGRMYGPLLCEVAVRTRETAACLEQQCPKHVWSFFVTQSEADRNAFQAATAGLKISIVHYSGNPEQVPSPPVPVSALSHLGVMGLLDDAYDAPPVVKAVLRDEGGTGRAYYGGQKAEVNSEAILATEGVAILWTPTMQYVTSKSRHSAAGSTRVVKLRPPRLLINNVNPTEHEKLVAERDAARRDIAAIEKEQRAAEARRDELGRGEGELRREMDALTKQDGAAERKRRGAEQLVASKQALLKAELNGPDPAVELPRAQARQAKRAKAAAEAAVKAAQLLVGLASALAGLGPPTLAAAELTEQARVLAAQTDTQSEAVKETAAAVAKAEAGKKAAITHAKALYATAVAVMPVEEQQAAEGRLGGPWPDDIEELEDLVAATLAEADAILCPNPGVMAEYKERGARIGALAKQLAAKSGELAGHQAGLDAVKADWLPKLRDLFTQVSAAFSDAFRAIGCVGQVQLEEHEDDFEAYAVNILVKFRPTEQLTKLTASRQSGGERSVATMLYLIALQDLTRCPFRVVDEINQGMDPTNERKIFKQMVASASAPGTPQCFLLTPKLLPQLDYQKEVTILCIFNGPWQAAVSRNWQSAHLLDGCDE